MNEATTAKNADKLVGAAALRVVAVVTKIVAAATTVAAAKTKVVNVSVELVDMPRMSARFRICRMRTANSKQLREGYRGQFCDPKLGVPDILV